MDEPLYFPSNRQWQNWLSRNQRKESEIWLIFLKKGSAEPSIPLRDAVETAICFGWIDSRIKSLDKERYMIRFTPRKKASPWSKYNIASAYKLFNQRKMTKTGIETLPGKVLETWKKQKRVPTEIDPRKRIITASSHEHS